MSDTQLKALICVDTSLFHCIVCGVAAVDSIYTSKIRIVPVSSEAVD
jgi:hypothetical protein